LRFQGVCYRDHDPKWAFTPTSGAGAAIHGGRFNPKGVEALYVALTLEGAFLEINQGFALKFAPCTMCSYDVDCDNLADLRTESGRQVHSVDFNDMACAWFSLAAAGTVPPSWQVAQRLMEEGFAGMLVPSAPGVTGPTLCSGIGVIGCPTGLPCTIPISNSRQSNALGPRALAVLMDPASYRCFCVSAPLLTKNHDPMPGALL
jgi:RES domain-containing protein